MCAGALRHWLDAHDELPTSPLVAMVPMLVGGAASDDDVHVAGLVVPLPTHVADPAERLKRTSDALDTAKQRRVAVPASLMQDVSMFAPPALSALAGRVVGALPHRSFVSPTVNLAITNVPGPRQPMYLAGRPLEASYPVLTINELSPLHIGLQSGPDSIDVGAVACRDTFDDLDALVERMPVELDELCRVTVARPGADTILESDGGPEMSDHARRAGPQSAAIFDLDRTLIAGPSGPAFSHSLDAAGIAQRRIPGHRCADGDVPRRSARPRSPHRPPASPPGRRAGGRCEIVRQAAEAAADELMDDRPAVRTQASSRSTARPAGCWRWRRPVRLPLVTPSPNASGWTPCIATEWAVAATASTPASSTGPVVWGRGKLEAVREWAEAEPGRPALARTPTATATTTPRCSTPSGTRSPSTPTCASSVWPACAAGRSATSTSPRACPRSPAGS